MLIDFTKAEGAGNDFIILPPGTAPLTKETTQRLCDRHKGIGADGIVYLDKRDNWTMTIYNADGSLAGMCGNATRCAALYLREKEGFGDAILPLDTEDGIKEVTLLPSTGDEGFRARVNLGQPRFAPADIPVKLPGDCIQDREISAKGQTFSITTVSMGNPHCVIFGDASILEDDFFLTWGPVLEKHEIFPDRCNIEFVQLLSPSEVNVRVWERGCGETQACGTGAAAICAAGEKTGRTGSTVLIHMPGGDLTLEKTGKGIFKTGPASLVFHGSIEL